MQPPLTATALPILQPGVEELRLKATTAKTWVKVQNNALDGKKTTTWPPNAVLIR